MVKYSGWTANHDQHENHKRHWDYDNGDIHVYVKPITLGAGNPDLYEVVAYGDDIHELINTALNDGHERLTEEYDKQQDALTVAKGLLDALHAGHMVIHNEPLNDTFVEVVDNLRVWINDMPEGYLSGVMMYMPEGLPHLTSREWFEYAVDYYMTGHRIGKETTYRLDIVADGNDNDGEYLDSYRKKSYVMGDEFYDLDI